MKKLVSILMILAMIVPLAGAQSTDIFKKKKKNSTHSQNISNVQGTTINQANGNITINSQDVRQERTKY